jgi:hypothetical protein
MEEFSTKDRRRLRQFLELEHSTEYVGEREAALAAATRLADSHGMTLREAVGMSDVEEPAQPPPPKREPPPRAAAAARDPFSQFERRFGLGRRHAPPEHAAQFRDEAERVAHEKRLRDEAIAAAHLRGLDAAELRRKRTAEWLNSRRSSTRWRPRGEFIRVLLRETTMTPREVALTAGVSVYEVYREKLLMRNAAA